MSRTTYSLRVMQLHQINGDTSTLQEILLTLQLAALPRGNWLNRHGYLDLNFYGICSSSLKLHS